MNADISGTENDNAGKLTPECWILCNFLRRFSGPIFFQLKIFQRFFFESEFFLKNIF